MATRRRRTRGTTTWQRAAAWLGVAVAVGLAVWSLGTVDDDRTSWSKHVTGAALALVALGWPSLSFAAPRAARRYAAVVGWTLSAALVWLGVEHWLNWFAFYETQGRSRVTSETGARFRGSLLIAIGVGGLVMIAAIRRATRTDDRPRAGSARRSQRRS